MKNALILLLMLILVGATGVLVSEADMNRTQEMGVDSPRPGPDPIPVPDCRPPNCIPGPIPYPDPVPGPKPDLYPTEWKTANSNPNYESRLAYLDGYLFGELRDKITGKIVLVVPLPEGNNTQSIWDVSPDGSTVFYGLGGTVYAQRITGNHEKISTPGTFTSISFDGNWAHLTGTVAGFPYQQPLWVNLETGEVRHIPPIN